MNSKLAITLIFLCLSNCLVGQSFEIEIVLKDSKTNELIRDAHVFIENTSYGSISNEKGEVRFTIPDEIKADMFISHIAYDIKLVSHHIYCNKSEIVEISLEPQSVQMEALVVTANRSKKWKKQFKKFSQAFLGSDKTAKECKILNPEVLRFSEENDDLFVSAVDLIQVENPYLGYEVYYLLYQLIVKADGSTEYLGKARFIDVANNDPVIEENRTQVYLNSPKFFFKSLIDDKLTANGFVAELVKYQNGQFEKSGEFLRSEIFKAGSNGKKFTLAFPDFLQVYNLDSRTVSYYNAGVRQGGLESSRFSASGRDKRAVYNFEKSQIFKKSPYIILNQHGNVLNTKDIKEYGFWANQKIAYMLPFEYGNDYIFESQAVSEAETNNYKKAYDCLISFIYGEERAIKIDNWDWLMDNWDDQYIGPFIELMRLSQDEWLLDNIGIALNEKYGIDKNINFFDALQWMWSQEYTQDALYFNFKAELYKNIDPLFKAYFDKRADEAKIRLDEVVWGGVLQDGIPPLRQAKHIQASEAVYLNDDNLVFGLFINGEARAYPKRILAWHEFFTNDFGGTKIAGVYCTLCGTVIAYNMNDQNGNFHDIGTSGFLYQSNKLMYDKATQSLWSTIEGAPVIGPLQDKGITLETYPVVTTTWAEWKKRHPETLVLSLDTGYDRDYGDGVAYKDYFSNDRLMFPVRKIDKRLNNKAEVFITRVNDYSTDPLAISVDYLSKKKWHQDQSAGIDFVALSDESGAVRSYLTEDIKFKSYRKGELKDSQGKLWQITEDYLYDNSGRKLYRIPGHNIFWFAWYNVYNNTRLVK